MTAASKAGDTQPRTCPWVPNEAAGAVPAEDIKVSGDRADVWPGSQHAVRHWWIWSIAGHRLDYSRHRLQAVSFRLQTPFSRQSCHVCVMLVSKLLIICCECIIKI